MGRLLVALAVMGALMCAAPAHADPPPPGCQTDPIFGLSPRIREICDLPIQPDGSWERWRWLTAIGGRMDRCARVTYCPPWIDPEWVDIPARQDGPVETYIVTADTIPPGEPGYIGG